MSEKAPFYVGVVLLNRTGELILLGKRREDGMWTGPGGSANEGETPRQAAIREVFEETAVQLGEDFLKDLPILTAKNGKQVHCFLAYDYSMGEPSPKHDPDKEVKKWNWYSLSEELPSPMDENRSRTIVNAKLFLSGLKKSIVLNEGIPGTELNTAEYSMDAMATKDNPKLAMLKQMIENLNLDQYAANNGQFSLGNSNMVSLVKVDDGCYSGQVKNEAGDIILRLEKMPIPSILQALEAKELISDQFAPVVAEKAPEKTDDIATTIGEQVIEMVKEHEQKWEGQEGSSAEQQADEQMAEQIEALVPETFKTSEAPKPQLFQLLDVLHNASSKELHIHLHKSELQAISEVLGKAVEEKCPIGTVKEHEGKKYQKIAEGHWKACQEEVEAKVNEAVEQTKKELADDRLAEDMKQHEKALKELRARMDKYAEQRAKERGKPIKDTPAKMDKELKSAEKKQEDLKEKLA